MVVKMKRRTFMQLISSFIALLVSGCHHNIDPDCENVISNITILSEVERLDKIECK